MTTFKPPVTYGNYQSYLWSYVTDKTGTVFQTLGGDIGAGTGWGTRVWRCPPGQPPQLVYYIEAGNGALTVDHMNKRLLFLGTTQQRQVFCEVIDGYVYPDDIPQPTIVNINESQLATVRQSIATATGIAEQAKAMAKDAEAMAYDTRDTVKALQGQIDALRNQVVAQQNQINALLTPNQVSDLVWSKIKDVNYLYRLAFLAWPTPAPDQDIRSYVADLVALIKKAK